jgi:hypothetical protein
MQNETDQKLCLQCGKQNPEGARFCCSCGCALKLKDRTDKTISVGVSKMALVAFAAALCGLVLTMQFLIAISWLRLRISEAHRVAFLTGLIVLGVTAILGLVSIIRIERSGGRITGRAFAIGAVLIGVLGSLVYPTWVAVGIRTRSVAFRMVCGTNLSGIGKATLIYANDYEDELPKAGGKSSVWAATIPDWQATNRFNAYNIRPDGSGGYGSISSSLYLLVKYAEVQPKNFICTGDTGIKEFKPGSYKAGDRELIDLWDFGPEPHKHYSYSYHVPYGGYALTTEFDPGLAVAADRNPWMDSPFQKARDFQAFDPNGSKEAVKAGNAITHNADAQNVLFIDCHVGQEKHSFCGLNDDNIYTYWNGKDIRRGTPPRLGSKPADRADSLLVNDPAMPK